MSSIRVRSYQPSDLAACTAIFAEVHRAYGNPMAYVTHALQSDMSDVQRNYLELSDAHWWVAVTVDDDRVVGQVAVQPLRLGDEFFYEQAPVDERDRICELRRMAIAPDMQRRGVGRALLSALLEFARAKGYAQVHLTTLTNMDKACAFYETHAFNKRQIERYAVGPMENEGDKEMQLMFSNRPKPVVFDSDAAVPDEDRRRMVLSPKDSTFLYVQHYSLMLDSLDVVDRPTTE
jgi:GNAT superfamily N-acetyltransferase